MFRAMLQMSLIRFLRQPAILLLFVIEVVFLALVGMGLHLEYEGGELVRASLFHEMDLQMYFAMVYGITKFLWQAFFFLLILGALSSVEQMIHGPLVPILLSNTVSRAWVLFVEFVAILFNVFLLQVVFSLALVLLVMLRGGESVATLFYPLIVGPLFQMSLLVALGLVLTVLFEQGMAPVVIVLLLYFLQPILYELAVRGTFLSKILLALLPPIAQVDRYTFSCLFKKNVAEFPWYFLVYVGVYLGIGWYVFKKKDITST